MKDLDKKELQGGIIHWGHLLKDAWDTYEWSEKDEQFLKQMLKLIEDFFAYLERTKDVDDRLTQAGLKIAKDGTLVTKPRVTKKEIFDFYAYLMFISGECVGAERREYIERWLESKGVVVEG